MGSRAIAASTPARPGLSAAVLREADSGIQVAIQKVHDDVDRNEEDRDREHSTLNERVIALHDGREEHAADAWDREDLLDDDRASEQLADLYAEERHHHDQPVFEDVAAQHGGRTQSFC